MCGGFLAAVIIYAPLLFAHGGGLDRNGGHYNRKTGVYHCHRCVNPKSAQSSSSRLSSSQGRSNFQSSASAAKVRTAQNLLIILNYDIGVADGLYGRKTRIAVTRFQTDYGLTPNGQINDRLILKLTEVVTAKSISGG